MIFVSAFVVHDDQLKNSVQYLFELVANIFVLSHVVPDLVTTSDEVVPSNFGSTEKAEQMPEDSRKNVAYLWSKRASTIGDVFQFSQVLKFRRVFR
jgi:hypothetical protein